MGSSVDLLEVSIRELLKVVGPTPAELRRHVAAVLFAVVGVLVVCGAVVLVISIH